MKKILVFLFLLAPLVGFSQLMVAQSAILGIGTKRITLFEDGFSLNTINTDKWSVTNPSDGVAIGATDQTIRFTATPASPVASSNTNYLLTTQSFDSDILVFRVTLGNNANSYNQLISFKCVNASDTYATARHASISRINPSSNVFIRVFNGTTNVYDYDTGASIPGNNAAYKIVVNTSTNNISFYVFGSGVWTQLGVTHNYDLGGALKLSLNANSNASDTGTPYAYFDTVFITDDDYSTSIPSTPN